MSRSRSESLNFSSTSHQYHSNMTSNISSSTPHKKRFSAIASLNSGGTDIGPSYPESYPNKDFSPSDSTRYSRKTNLIRSVVGRLPLSSHKLLDRTDSRIIDPSDELPPPYFQKINISSTLLSLKQDIGNLKLLQIDIENKPGLWRNFISQSLMYFKPWDSEKHSFPQMPTESIQSNLSGFEQLLIIKHLRPDALESFMTALIGEERHKSYALLSRTNFETHCNLHWHRRPTVLFYNADSENPYFHIDMLAQQRQKATKRIPIHKYDSRCISKVHVSDAMNEAAWLIIEHTNLMSKSQLVRLVKILEEELSSDKISESSRVWILYSVDTPAYHPLDIADPHIKHILLPFFRTCHKAFLNKTNSVRSHMLDTYREEISAYYHQKEQQQSQRTPAYHRAVTTLRGLQNHRLTVQNCSDKLDLHEFYEKRLPKPEEASLGGGSPEKRTALTQFISDENLAILSFRLKFMFSVLKCRMQFEKSWRVHGNRTYEVYLTDLDLEDITYDLIKFLSTYRGPTDRFLEKYLLAYLSCTSQQFSTFSQPVISHFIKEILRKAQVASIVKVCICGPLLR